MQPKHNIMQCNITKIKGETRFRWHPDLGLGSWVKQVLWCQPSPSQWTQEQREKRKKAKGRRKEHGRTKKRGKGRYGSGKCGREEKPSGNQMNKVVEIQLNLHEGLRPGACSCVQQPQNSSHFIFSNKEL